MGAIIIRDVSLPGWPVAVFKGGIEHGAPMKYSYTSSMKNGAQRLDSKTMPCTSTISMPRSSINWARPQALDFSFQGTRSTLDRRRRSPVVQKILAKRHVGRPFQAVRLLPMILCEGICCLYRELVNASTRRLTVGLEGVLLLKFDGRPGRPSYVLKWKAVLRSSSNSACWQ